MKRYGGVAAMAVGVVLTTGCGVVPTMGAASTSSSTSSASLLAEATGTCSSMPRSVLSQDGKSANLDTKGKEDFNGDDMEDVRCFLRELGAPDYVADHIGSTRALDGQQTDEWDDIEARWSYHPNDGLDITFIDRS